MQSKIQPKWSTTAFVAIGALAALTTVLSLPGAMVGGVTGMYILSVTANILLIGIMYSLVCLIMKRFGAATLWAFIVGVMAVPLPIEGPPGFFPKIVYSTFWGVLADLTYFLFRKSERIAAAAIGAVQLGPGVFFAIFAWAILGAPQLADAYKQYLTIPWIAGLSALGGVLGYAGYLIYSKIRDTAVIRRIQ